MKMNDDEFKEYSLRLKGVVDLFERAAGQRLTWDRDEVMRAANLRDANGRPVIYLDKDGRTVVSDHAALAEVAPSLYSGTDDRSKATRAAAAERKLTGNPRAAGMPDKSAAQIELDALPKLGPNASDTAKCERADRVAQIYKKHGF